MLMKTHGGEGPGGNMFAFLGMEVTVVAFCTLISQLEGYPGLGDLATEIAVMMVIFHLRTLYRRSLGQF